MAKRKRVFLLFLIGISIFHLAGCGDKPDSVENPMENGAISDMGHAEDVMAGAETDTSMLSEENQGRAEEEPEAKGGEALAEEAEAEETEGEEAEAEDVEDEEAETEKGADDTYKEIPQLPGTGRKLEDFVPEGWEILDKVELDFNEDKIPDYVGVLQAVLTDADGYLAFQDYPRILFAIASDGEGEYRLDFQDINLIRTRSEGGVFGDPYMPLTAEGTSFETHAYGGSAWRWSEDNTYTYRKGTWWLTSSQDTYGYYEYTTSYSKNDWESGVGIRKKRSSEFSDMEEHWESEEDEYDVIYEVSLDDALTLEQAGKRWWLAPDRIAGWEVEEIVFAEDVELSEEMVKLPEDAYVEYCDEDCVLYTFNAGPDTDKGLYCLAMYRWQDKVLSVLAREEAAAIAYPELYKGKIYYSADIVENVPYREMQDGVEQIVEEEETVGVRLIRMNLDGTKKETVFEYRYQESTEETMGRGIPYLSLIYEISGDEIVAEVYIGDAPHLFYRMKTDGSGKQKIGQMPKG